MLARSDVDAVIVATPDHWHGTIALAAMEAGKDVYLEKPMTHTIEEAQQVARKVKQSGRVLQVGSQTTSRDQWWKARKAIEDGMIGKLISSQGSYHRNSLEGEWNWTPERRGNNWQIETDAGPDGKGVNYIDWNMWLGPARKRSFDPERYFPFPKVLGLLRRGRHGFVLSRRRAFADLLGRGTISPSGQRRGVASTLSRTARSLTLSM